MSAVKELGYAYPGSTLAKWMKLTDSGCWYLAVFPDQHTIIAPSHVKYASPSKAFTMEHAEHYKEPWGAFSMHKEP